MASKKPPASPRRLALKAALAAGAYQSFLGASIRRTILMEQAVRSMSRDAGLVFAREIEAPILIAVATMLAGRGSGQPFRLERGTPGAFDQGAGAAIPTLPPPPPTMPASLTTALRDIGANGGRRVFAGMQTDFREVARQETAFTAKAMVRAYGTEALARAPLARIEANAGAEPPTGPLGGPTAEAAVEAIASTADRAPVFGKLVEDVWGKSIDGMRSKVEELVGTSLQRGDQVDDIVRALRGTKSKGFSDGMLSKWRGSQIKTFVRTVTTHISAKAREGAAAVLGAEFVQLVATLDLRTTPQCIELDLSVWPIGEGPRPPIHPNAVLEGSTFVPYGDCEEIVHARYDGPCVHVLAGGYRTTIGPNHPMLTARGLVKAAELREGDKLLRDLRHDRSVRHGEAHFEKVRPVEDVLRSLLSVGPRRAVATASHDLHGDRIFCEGEVEVVEAKGLLLSILDTEGIQKLRELDLVHADVQSRSVAGHRPGDLRSARVALPPAGGVRSLDSWILADDHWVWVPVEKLSHGRFRGRAFDATTASSLYCSDGFVVSNCRTDVVPWWSEDKPEFGGTRASKDGKIPSTTAAKQWWEDLPADEQDSIIGPARGKALRAGDLEWSQLFDDGLRLLTLSDLRAKGLLPSQRG